MKGRCNYCGRILRYANIPNRGPVMAHAKGDGEICRRLIHSGNDLISRQIRQNRITMLRAYGSHIIDYIDKVPLP